MIKEKTWKAPYISAANVTISAYASYAFLNGSSEDLAVYALPVAITIGTIASGQIFGDSGVDAIKKAGSASLDVLMGSVMGAALTLSNYF